MKIINIRKESPLITLVFIGTIIYRLLMSLQGVDNTDVGFCNTFYQAIFKSPDSNEFNYIYYLTGLVGGIWEYYFGKFGLVGFRFLETMTLAASIYMLYSIYKEKMSKNQSVAAIGLSMLFPVIIVTFHYDTLSYLFITVSAYMYSKSFVRSNPYIWLFFSGIFIGLNFFARIVNLSFCILALIPLFINNLPIKQKAQLCISMIGGMIVGATIIIIIMVLCGHISYYLAGLNEAFATLDRTNATHSKGEMIFRYIKSLKNVVLQICILGVIAFATYHNAKKKSQYKKYIKVLLYICIFIVTQTSLVYLTTLAASLIIIILESFNLRKAKEENSNNQIAIFLLTATLCFPMGSDIGLQGIFNWCAGLLIFPAIYYYKYIKEKSLIALTKVTYISIIIGAIIKMSYCAYGETLPRTKCWTMIQTSRLNVMSDTLQAKHYQKAIAAIKHFSEKEQNLLLTNQAAQLYYATEKCLI